MALEVQAVLPPWERVAAKTPTSALPTLFDRFLGGGLGAGPFGAGFGVGVAGLPRAALARAEGFG